MAADNATGRDPIRAALGPGRDCLPVAALERCVDPESVPAELAAHLGSCFHCRTELDLLRSFLRAPSGDEAEAIGGITERLRLPGTCAEVARSPWWKDLLQVRRLRLAAVAMAGVFIAIAIGLQWRHGSAPRLNVPNQPEMEVLRSGSIPVIAPTGDITEAPTRIQWQPVPGARQYRIRLLEVDRSELWNTLTSGPEAAIPAPIRSKIVPAKTLLVQVIAFDSSDRKLAESDYVHFRLLQKVYSH